MRWGISIFGAASVALAAASCASLRRKTGEPHNRLVSPANQDRYLSPLIPLARSMVPTQYPSSGVREFLIGASFVCDGPLGDQKAKSRCEQNAQKMVKKIEELAGRKVPCSTDKPHEGNVSEAKTPTTRYEWTCPVGRSSRWSMDTIWREARNRFLGPGAPKDRKQVGGLDQIEVELSKPIPNDPVGQALYMFGRKDRPLTDAKLPGSTYHLYGQDVRDSDLEPDEEWVGSLAKFFQ